MARSTKIRSLSGHVPMKFATRNRLLGPEFIGALLFLLAAATGFVVAEDLIDRFGLHPSI